MADRTRVLVYDDSPAFVAALRRVLERDDDIRVETPRAGAALEVAAFAESPPDLLAVALDSRAGGIALIEEIMSTRPLPILVLESGSVCADGATARAAGALDAIGKDDLDLAPDGPAAAELRRRIKLLARVPVIRHPRGRLRSETSRPQLPVALQRRTATHVAIAASTGGPPALNAVLGCLPGTFEVPILVVQHMTTGFTGGLASWLDQQLELPVRVATEGIRPGPGVWFAPEEAHLVLAADGTLAFDRRTPPSPHRPAADVLFRSLAANVGRSAAAIVLSGMGADGAGGTAAVREAGGTTIAQDEATSAVYGMPRAAAERGAEHVLPLDAIGAALASLGKVRA